MSSGSGYTLRNFTDSTDSTDHGRPRTGRSVKLSQDLYRPTDLLPFLRQWFRGTIGGEVDHALREVFWCEGDLRDCRRRFRGPFTLVGIEGFLKSFGRLASLNVLMGVGFWLSTESLEPSERLMRYDRLFYDFDSEAEPERAREAALDFAESLRRAYGVVPIVVDSGFKGAHVYVFLSKPASWSSYRALWDYLLGRYGRPELVDRNVLQYNRLARVPYTYNVKEGRKVLARVVYPRELNPKDFDLREVVPLDSSKLRVYVVEGIELPEEVEAKEAPKGRGVRWIEGVIERGVPDGRKRLLALAIIPYLVNVLKLSDPEVEARVRGFLEACCRNHGRCEDVGSRWIQYEIRRVRERGYGPIGYEKLAESYRDLYDLVRASLEVRSAAADSAASSLPPELAEFLKEAQLAEFSYEDFRRWLEGRGPLDASTWHHWERTLRKLAESGLLGRKFYVNGVWVDYGAGPVRKPPSREVRFYLVGPSKE